MAGGLQLILDALKASRKQAEPIRDAYNAGYRNLVHRTVGDIDNPVLNPRINANVGTHADFVGGPQAQQLLESYTDMGLPRPGILTLLARAKKPIYMTDAEINDPGAMANALHDRQLMKEVNWAQFRYPEHMIDLPWGVEGAEETTLPLAKVLNRRAAERALQRKGYDSVLYQNEVEGKFDKYDPRFVSQDIYPSLKKREDLAQSLVEYNPVPQYGNVVLDAINPSISVLGGSGYRLPFGDLINKRDFTSHGYKQGGLAQCQAH